MPCNGDHLNHTSNEEESGRVLEFLKEISGQPFDHERPDYYGRPETLDADTATLCGWLRAHLAAVPSLSLELQLWWRRHQEHDRRRETEEQQRKERRQRRDEALAKLTAAERDALGLKEQQ